MNEREEAIRLANKILDRPYDDPDDDLAILSRQLLRSQEVIEKLKADLAASYDPMGDLIQANRDSILRVHEEGLRRVKKCLEVCDGAKALKVIEAINTFHPMHCESWGGWPE